MEVERETVDVAVYEITEIMGNEQYIWDFGVFTLVGDEDYPLRKLENMISHGAMSAGVGKNEWDQKEKLNEETINVYMGDYVVYVPTRLSDASHIISGSMELYKVKERGIKDSDGKTNIVISEVGRYKEKFNRLIPEKEAKNEWIPVMQM